ncbi:undecaprenyl-phosphate alpha-N-acetylglucosaminyl 1-phosphate transferase [Virgibacillus profundi]|uniref:Undecaprenyl-phosphate alpha-N-acetylglucosaminyl 1-phosphate transferase n=1 Tax=Virgibacillus profundi TaxID=2024555 RepID=A0A2A2IJM5_9BACI|nr:MraY family glycosyltransferase [Virgibacillus profundi]PAV31305.1 undecaprenyl-phosphate alpha-N-acetylglucosaminyl 1-phosphate transferase [Virgibacillus profundi]PXY55490.1 undecaprenyl/decaprenyl-phosphate alpha-N-acetylglucosaminyl 1-phosphate transferase [Virgibacillus profundi]
MAYLALIISFVTTILLTPAVKKIAVKIGAVDYPNQRKVHKKVMPRLGGLSIYISFVLWLIIFEPSNVYIWPLIVGGTIIMAVGLLDDLYELSAKVKLLGQLAAAVTVVLGGIQIDFINLPFDGKLEFGMWTIPITILWIVGVTNAINLIDGLDGLAAGVSAIALLTISGLAITMGNSLAIFAGLILLGSTLGFLVYNFHPAKIFLGDTGSLFLGFMISVLAILGFKNVTMFSIIVPMIILAIPISDTFFAMVRRLIQKKPISSPDKLHLHHCLIDLGYSHRSTVLIIYFLSALFGIAAIIFTKATLWISLVVLIALAVLIELIVEITGLIGKSYRPLLNLFSRVR